MKFRSEILAAPLAAIMCLAALPSQAQTAGAKIETGVSAAAINVKAEDLTGENVRSAQNGENIGEIKAVIIDPAGSVNAVIVGVGGFLGIGEHEVAVPWDKLTRNPNNVYMLDMSKDDVRALPAYVYPADRADRTAFQDPNYGLRDRMSGAPALSTDRPATATMNRTDRNGTMATANGAPRDDRSGWTKSLTPDGRIKASSFVGAEVMNAQDEAIGEIEEVLIGQNGNPQALVSVGGFLGVGERHVLLNWSDLKIDRNKDSVRVAVNMTKEQLQKLTPYKE